MTTCAEQTKALTAPNGIVIRKAQVIWSRAGYRISGSALTSPGKVPNLTSETFETLVWHAVMNCPTSKVLRARIRLDAKLL